MDKDVFESGNCISLNQILNHDPKLSFYINDYQRGYRWTKDEVGKLLDDLTYYFENNNEDKSFYCLQPLIVARGKDKKDNDVLEVLDGQQRLTTMLIVLKALKQMGFGNSGSKEYSVDYDTRPGSKEFLDGIRDKTEKESDKYIDYYHMYQAYNAVQDYKEWNDDVKRKIIDGKRVKFIWYDVTKQVAKQVTDQVTGKTSYVIDSRKVREVFARFNAGKIALTDAELVKALFLMKIKDYIDNENTCLDEQTRNTLIQLERERLSTKWDEIENTLNEPDFWGFIYGKDDDKYPTRIEYILDSLSSNQRTYDYFDKNLNSSSVSVITEWNRIADLFDLYKNWYDNKVLYHLIGFLRFCDVSIITIKEIYDCADNHSDFLRTIEKLSKAYAVSIDDDETKIKNALKGLNKKDANKYKELNDLIGTLSKEDNKNDELRKFLESDSVTYVNNKDNVIKILFLFNILAVAHQKNDMRLSFSSFYSQEYDLEHISSQTPKDMEDANEKRGWAISLLEFLTGYEYKCDSNRKSDKKIALNVFVDSITADSCVNNKPVIQNLIKLTKGDDLNLAFTELIDAVKIEIRMDKTVEPFDGNGIQNLVLLDSNTNRSYGNALFPVKRYWIYSQESRGIYILPVTKNVFNKSYDKRLVDMMEWTQTDADSYLKAMVDVWTTTLI